MCGRYTLKTDAKQIQAELGLDELPSLAPRYNIAPTQAAPIVTAPGKLTLAQWGLIPHWAPDATIAGRLINARADSLEEKPAFREAFKRRRCLVVADGFYEWQHHGKVSQPFFIHQASDRPFTLAGLYELWHAPNGLEVTSFTIVTTAADPFMSKLHDRMPVFVAPEQRARWLAATEDVAALKPLLAPGSPEPLAAYEVERHVNSVAFDDARCLEPAKQVQLSLL
ncbi:MAG: SOS response-associated peptidase [Archangiaceae bacterium]|nr:SOS response-associated peptidase [Archangiaceae bacterium]